MRTLKMLAVALTALIAITFNGILISQAQARGAPHIILLKGFADIFSNGLDALAVELRQRGITAQVASHASGYSLANELIQKYAAGDRGPIILVGHSFGADSAVEMAKELNTKKIPVALIVTYGPTLSNTVPGNVARAYNYFQASSAWRGRLLKSPGFRGTLVNVDLDNAPDVNHFNIDKIARLHADTIGRILAVLGRRR
jgi:pimeloyl-ACP methyl ester carboxylesterase